MKFAIRRVLAVALCALIVCACSSEKLAFVPAVDTVPPSISPLSIATAAYDSLQGGPCKLSADGVIWYNVTPGRFAPLWASSIQCSAPATLLSNLPVPVPFWSVPRAPTKAIFTAVSLQEQLGFGGMSQIESVAAAHHVPVTWLVGNAAYFLAQPDVYTQFRNANGDGIETRLDPELRSTATRLYPWYTPSVAVLGAGAERDITGARSVGAFWGITWNSRGTDRTFDEGAPWGTYCADVHSYKRPDPSGDCSLVAFEWTARDLTRAYYSGREDAYSTVPEDLFTRAGFTPQSVAPYVRSIVDAYAAAATDQPLVLVAEEESANFSGSADAVMLDALYAQAESRGMTRLTLHDAVAAARSFSSRPRAIAFPFIDAGTSAFMPARIVGGTIDYHDNQVGMTFEAGVTMPRRVFPYARTAMSRYDVELARLAAGEMPRLTMAQVSGGSLVLHVESPVATPYGLAIWSDPIRLGLSGPAVTAAGSAAAVLRFDVPAGASDHVFACPGCTSATFDYAR